MLTYAKHYIMYARPRGSNQIVPCGKGPSGRKNLLSRHTQNMDETTEKPWKKYFQNSVSDYQGCVGTLQDAECLIRSFEIDTTTTFAVYKSKSKGFGSTGNDDFFCTNIFKRNSFNKKNNLCTGEIIVGYPKAYIKSKAYTYLFKKLSMRAED